MRARLLYRRAETALLIPEGRSRFQAPNRQICSAPPTVPKLKGVSPLRAWVGGETRQVSLCLSGLQLRGVGSWPSAGKERAAAGPQRHQSGGNGPTPQCDPGTPIRGASCPESTLGEQGKGRRPTAHRSERGGGDGPTRPMRSGYPGRGASCAGVDESYRRSAGEKRGPPPTAAQWATTTAGDDPVMSPVLPRYPGPGSFMPRGGPGGVGKLTTDRRVGRRKEHSSDKPPR